LYFPSPSVHETPTWNSSDLCFCDGATNSVSAAGASRLKSCGEDQRDVRKPLRGEVPWTNEILRL
jgi:hypothetical protein